MPEEFPWPSNFAISKARRDRGFSILGLQVRWDDKRNLDDLPIDPKHASKEDMVGLYIGSHYLPPTNA